MTRSVLLVLAVAFTAPAHADPKPDRDRAAPVAEKQNVRDHAAAIEEAVRALRQRARELKAKPLAKLADDLEQMLAAARKKAKGAGDQLGKSDVQDIRQRAKQDVQLMSNVTEKQRDVAMAIIEKI